MPTNEKVRKTILEIVDKIRKLYQPQKIILFGSYAYGMPDRDSDVDLLVVTEKRLSMDEIYTTRRKLSGLSSVPLQIVVMDSTEFIETKDVIGGIAYPADKYGEMLYEKS